MTNNLGLAVTSEIEKHCDCYIDCAGMTEEEFALSRRNGLGASDSSIILGLQKQWRSETDLIANKLTTVYTAEEKETSMKPNVRKGKDLEPLILQKFSTKMNIPLVKPIMMYRLKEFPYLTISYDGVGIDKFNKIIPIEAKFVSTYGDRYWGFDRPEEILKETFIPEYTGRFSELDIVRHCEEASDYYGVPSYYYVQVQQQMMGLDSEYGYITSLRDKNWELYVFYIWADPWLQKRIISEGYRVWTQIERQRNQLQS